ncbi:MAG: GHKL domain-containing protein, partial [Candidatus Zixiibacteriota bacterium]
VEAIDLKVLFEEILADRSRFEAVGTAVDVKIDEPSTVRMARVHAYSLFNNLMNNALDAVDEVKKRKIMVRAEGNGGEVKVQISDTGPGIDPDVLPKIFSPFFSTKPRKGTGLGLAICKRIVDIYKGEILVDSSLDRGTTFTILLKT